jgi:general secretion pathway protein C
MNRPRTNASMIVCALVALAAQVSGCARASAPAAASAPVADEPVAALSSGSSASAPRGPHRALTRALIEETLSEGLGAFLSRVSVAPVVQGTRFVGFRLESAEDLEAWRTAGADLRVGDVVQRINGQTIERPEQALWAFEQLRIARGVEVVGLRGTTPFRVYSPIVDAQ